MKRTIEDAQFKKTPIEERRTKRIDMEIPKHDFVPGQQVLLLRSRVKMSPRKVKSEWSGPFNIMKVFSWGTVELKGKNRYLFCVNHERLKHYGKKERNLASIPIEDPT